MFIDYIEVKELPKAASSRSYIRSGSTSFFFFEKRYRWIETPHLRSSNRGRTNGKTKYCFRQSGLSLLSWNNQVLHPALMCRKSPKLTIFAIHLRSPHIFERFCTTPTWQLLRTGNSLIGSTGYIGLESVGGRSVSHAITTSRGDQSPIFQNQFSFP
jgi:hypothetical protein